MSPQSNEYKNTQKVDAMGDMPGADLARDLLKVSLDDQTKVLTTELAEALSSNDGDTLLVEQSSTFDAAVQNWPTDDPATESTLAALASALKSEDTDALVVEHDGVIDVSNRDDRTLGDVDITALPDVTIATLPDNDVDDLDGATLAADSSLDLSVTAQGADNIRGTVVSSGTYDVTISWQTSTGTEIESVDIATGVTEPALSPYTVVTVTDTSSAEQTVDGVTHLA